MSIPLSQILRNIEKSTQKKKPKLEQDPQGFIDESIQQTATKKQEAQQKQIETEEKLKEYDPQTFKEDPSSKEAQKFYRLNELSRKLYLKALRLEKEDQHIQGVSNYKKQDSQEPAREYIKDILSNEAGSGKKQGNVEARTNVITTKINSMINNVRVELRTTFGGLKQNKELGYEIIRYLKDGKTKNKGLEAKTKQLSDQWKEGAEAIKSLRNEAGGEIGNLEDWIMPQVHDKLKMLKVGHSEYKLLKKTDNAKYQALKKNRYEKYKFIKESSKKKWIEEITPKLDIKRIEAEQEASIDKILDTAWDNITARGEAGTRKDLSRVLHFKDGDSIVEYNKIYGNDDVLSIFDTHIRTQANEIAQMQILGPNPELTFNKLKELARNEGMGTFKEESLNRLFRTSTGKVDSENIIDTLDSTITGISQGYRSLQIASKLGGATLSSIADVSNMLITGGYRGLNGFKMFGRGVGVLLEEALNKGVGSKTQLASRIGVVSEFASASITNNRFSEAGAGWLQRRAENVLRFSGLTAWTNALRTGFGLELSGTIAEHFGKSYDSLPFKKLFEEYGIDKTDWADIQKSKLEDFKGAKFLNINNLEESLAYKVGGMIDNEMNSTIAMAGYRTRAITTWGAEKGTFAGELARNLSLFKSFPITIMMIHLNRMGHMTNQGKLAYATGVITTGAIFGTISLWLKDIARGETPRDINRKQMIPEAILQSGGLGIFGDFFLQDTSRYGHSFTSTLVGVPATTIEDIGRSAVELMTGNEDIIKNSYNRAKGYIPGQNLWYTRVLFQKGLEEFIGNVLDPDIAKKKRRYKKALRLRGQELIFE